MTATISFKCVGKCYTIKKDGIKSNLWALRNFTFEADSGEIVGFIGSNGAGKSTLLKVASRVTSPTTGKIIINGRTGSLLEVGTGFHPELTGMENIYFNGAIIGISKREIDENLDNIIKFSGVEKFIDTPVKRYSSGMYTRLAFAIASQLDVENMFIDEVLAVGDAEFQKKCISKMNDMARSGRTILFVSHDMSAITRLCDRVVWLHNGEIKQIGESNEIVSSYITHTVPRGTHLSIGELLKNLPEDPTIKLLSIELTSCKKPIDVFFRDRSIEVAITYKVFRLEPGLRIYLKILDDRGNIVMRTYHDNDKLMLHDPGVYCATIVIPPNFLAHREYEISIGALIFNIRNCTGNNGEGIRIPVDIELISPIDSYPEEAYSYRPMIEPTLRWNTNKIN